MTNTRTSPALHVPDRPVGRHKVALVALDAADASLLLEGIEAGRLPSLAKMKDAGAWGMVDAPRGFGSGAGWVTFATGVTPARHGRYFYRRILPGSYEAEQFGGDELKNPTFAHVLSDAGKKVAVFDFPCVPVIPGINGISVADWLTHDLVYDKMRTEPPELAEQIADRFGANALRKCDRPGGRNREEHAVLYGQLVERIGQRMEGTLHYLDDDDWDLFVTTFSESHCVGHQCWHLRDPRHPLHEPVDPELASDPVMGVYEAMDAAIGDITARLDDDTTLIVMSTTGMGPNYTGNRILDTVLRQRDGFRATAKWTAVSTAKNLAKKVLPSSVRSKYARLNRRVQESAQVGDRSRRPSFVVPHNDLSGAIRLNIVGREPDGVLHRGEEVDRYVEGLRRDLLELRNLDTGNPVVRDVVRVSDEISGDVLDELPDLFVLWERETYPDRVGSDRIGECVARHRGNRTGDHVPHHIFFAVGPTVVPGRLDGRVIQDFAPTITAIAGVDFPDGDGSVIPELVEQHR